MRRAIASWSRIRKLFTASGNQADGREGAFALARTGYSDQAERQSPEHRRDIDLDFLDGTFACASSLNVGWRKVVNRWFWNSHSPRSTSPPLRTVAELHEDRFLPLVKKSGRVEVP